MELTIGKKLLLGKISILLLVFVIVLTGVNSINNLSKTSNKMEVEYKEVNAIQELRISFQQILLSVKNYLIKGRSTEINNFERYLSNTKKQMIECREIVTNNHSKELLGNFEKDIIIVESLSRKLFKLDITIDTVTTKVLMEEISSISHLAVVEINEISMESKREMNKYIEDNRKTNERGKRSIILIGIITACCLIIGGFFFLRGIMNPINRLMQTTKKISSGNLSAQTNIDTHDEIGNLIESFNKMIGILDRTTVSRDYLDNILSRMDDSLVITDTEYKIIVVNQATLALLGYTEKEIIGQSFEILLGKKVDREAFTKNTIINELKGNEHLHNIYNTYYSKEGDKIPVLFSGSLMYDDNGSNNGLICIANHHIVENNQEENTTPLNYEKESDLQTIKTIGEIPLTKREREIMKLIAEELSNQEIAERLFISIRTVETHRKNIMQKLHTKSVIALVKYATLNGII